MKICIDFASHRKTLKKKIEKDKNTVRKGQKHRIFWVIIAVQKIILLALFPV